VNGWLDGWRDDRRCNYRQCLATDESARQTNTVNGTMTARRGRRWARSRDQGQLVFLNRTRARRLIADRCSSFVGDSSRGCFAACREDEIIQAASINSTTGSINARKIVVKISGTGGRDRQNGDLRELYKF